jgi:hypothetical protein
MLRDANLLPLGSGHLCGLKWINRKQENVTVLVQIGLFFYPTASVSIDYINGLYNIQSNLY